MRFFRSALAATKRSTGTAAVSFGVSYTLYSLVASDRNLTATHSEANQQCRPDKGNDHPHNDDDKDARFEGECLKRQLHQPKVPYPAWDYNWDGKMTPNATLESVSTPQGLYASKSKGKTRHILLVRHGQYDMTFEEDEKRVLTPLGRRQAIATGQRLAIMARGGLGGMDERFCKPINIKAIRVSDMARAKETALLISSWLPGVPLTEPDPLLNEGLPAPMIPKRADVPNQEKEIDENRERIEQAFQKYIYRADPPLGLQEDSKGEVNDDGVEQEFEVIVCHGNVIRHLFCRALQLPPEAWLRFSTFNCSITYLMIHPNGYVSARMMGDTGHLTYDETTFSDSHGFNW
jgi:serine/threonine-protein phosphatase PGAM5